MFKFTKKLQQHYDEQEIGAEGSIYLTDKDRKALQKKAKKEVFLDFHNCDKPKNKANSYKKPQISLKFLFKRILVYKIAYFYSINILSIFDVLT